MIVLAAVMAWEVHRGTQAGTLTGTRKGVYVAIIIVSLSAGLAGLKERHRPSDDV